MFGRSAKKLSEELERIGNVSISVNPEKPGKGNFVVSVLMNQKTTEIVGLRGLPRPFKALRELDIGSVAEKISKLH